MLLLSSTLPKAEKLYLLKELFGKVLIEEEVRREQ